MKTTGNALVQAIREFAAALECAAREDGGKFVKLADGAPEWMTAAVMAAHDNGGRLPTDQIYDMCSEAADAMADASDQSEDGFREVLFEHEFASVYHADRCAWLASHVANVGLVDEAVAEFGWPKGGISDAIAIAWNEQGRAIGECILSACIERAAEIEEEDDDAQDDE